MEKTELQGKVSKRLDGARDKVRDGKNSLFLDGVKNIIGGEYRGQRATTHISVQGHP